MIIDFTVRNFLSIKDEVTLSFSSSKPQEDGKVQIVPIENGKYNVYSFSAIYGPNASGKSNIIKALEAFKEFIISSNRNNLDDKITQYQPFKFEKNTQKAPTYFSIEFITDDIRYLYSIEFNHKQIITETLVFFPEGKKATLFTRENTQIKYGTYFKGEKKNLETFLLPNRLFLSVVANSQNEILNPVYRFFLSRVNVHTKMDSSSNIFNATTAILSDSDVRFKQSLLRILQAADLSIQDIKIEDDKQKLDHIKFPDTMPENIKNKIICDLEKKPFLGHSVFDNGKRTTEIEYLDLNKEESTGTIKMYDLTGEIFSAITEGSVLIVDEFNSGLHPLLTNFIINLFTDSCLNKKNAQLLIATHDIAMLDTETLKREQIWFTDKKEDSSTDLYSLDEFDKNSVRDYSKFAKMYLDGRFKAVPSTCIKNLEEGTF